MSMKPILFFISCLLAFTAGHMVNYSVIIYSQEVLKSNLLAGIGFGLCFGPPLFFGWIAGVLCDRVPPARLIHAAQFVFVCAAAILWGSHHFISLASDRAPFVMMAAFCAGLGWSFVSPARMTVLAQVVKPSQLKLASIVFNLLVMLGFGLGPILISALRGSGTDANLLGWSKVFMTAASFFILGSLLLIPIQTKALGTSKKSALNELVEGLRFAKSHPEVRDLLVSALIGYSLMGPIQVLLPRLAKDILGLTEMARGSFLGALAPSLIVGGIFSMTLAKKGPTKKLVYFSIIFAGCLFAMLGLAHTTWVATLLLISVGILGGCGLSLIVASLQAAVDDRVRGRILSQYTIISQVIPAASGIFAGTLAHFSSVTTAIIVCGFLIALTKGLRPVFSAFAIRNSELKTS